ncbi:MAG: hypothetical protein CEN89_398 [Candidatus Berkelbacteria bacterium Licking1014_7]|uniref:DUF5673 domain-containing protein n=1 Tax=Candidatus Berkelbacteria bacterium Licking1014_7 TaxID=2017147 RepID=A0A554LJ40_9BACT|nr:MAG: hypothetical protein CEN89_398 [Candidatus Berkelbacteria bacterium Licking1014_7]
MLNKKINQPSKTELAAKIQTKKPQTIEFQTPEFPYHKKNIWWSSAFTIIAALLILILLFNAFYFLTIIMLAAILVFVKLSFEKPKKIKIKMSADGLTRKNRFYPWGAFASFSILNFKQGKARLYFNFPFWLSIPLTLEVDKSSKIKMIDLTQFLRQCLPEKFIRHSHFIDAFNEYLRF